MAKVHHSLCRKEPLVKLRAVQPKGQLLDHHDRDVYGTVVLRKALKLIDCLTDTLGSVRAFGIDRLDLDFNPSIVQTLPS
jgi:hypothetical protein